MVDIKKLEALARLVRFYVLEMTTRAGSGHPTSSLSATDLMVTLYFNKLRFDLKNPQNPNNDRVIFSKGHASPLFYALYRVAGVISDQELDTYREFESKLEGHPTPRFKYAEAATGSLGQGLSIGVGMALAARLDQLSYNIYVLMGDSEMAEGSIWEAMELASFNKLSNLVGIIDVNRLGQSGETMLGWDTNKYKERVEAFGWKAKVINGHSVEEINQALESLSAPSDKPQMIVAKTIKGKGVSFLEDKEGWHGKPLSAEELEKAFLELGVVDKGLKAEIKEPEDVKAGKIIVGSYQRPSYKLGEMLATRKAYGEAVAALGMAKSSIVCLDGEVKNSTFAEIFKKKVPERYFEMFIAEQNMVGVALGLARRGKVPFVSSFSAFLTRAFDQIRMSAISMGNVKFVGSHAGVSIGEDGPSQMGLEDIAMFRPVFGSVVLCPSDAVSCVKLVEKMAETEGICYLRTLRPAVPVIYKNEEDFELGGSKIVRSSKKDKLTIVACGVTLHEAIRAADDLQKDDISVRLIDAYSIKPIDAKILIRCADETDRLIITVEDHYFDGGLGDAVLNVFATYARVKIYKMAVSKMPMSGKAEELLNYEEISAAAIVKKAKEILK